MRSTTTPEYSTGRCASRPGLAVVTLSTALLMFVGAVPAADRLVTDPGISAAIENEIAYDPAIAPGGIDVHTDDGIVTLRGRVPNLLAKQRAERLAATVRGARSVINEIEVEAILDMTAGDVERSVDEALLADPATESFEIGVSAGDDGRVTLTGRVQSWQERSLAATVAAGVYGVTAVDNDIDVTPPLRRPDAEIRADVRAALRWDAAVDDALLDVSVEQGEVELTGTVGSLAEKNVAVSNAWVAGVTRVDGTGIEVARWARDDALRAGKYAIRDDAEIEDAVGRALMYDPRVSRFTIDVESDAGMVTLHGTVADLKAKRAALADAGNTVGVVAIRDRLHVRPGETVPPDSTIAASVRQALARDPYVEGLGIDVSVRGGIVDLRGTVDTWFEKGVADDVAARVRGVVAVDNELVVDHDVPVVVFDPYVDDWSLQEYDWYEPRLRPPREPDAVIADAIRDELWWSPYVDTEDVEVSVARGVATLSGAVDSWAERRAATANALEGGATSVVNDIVVRSPDPADRPARARQQ